MNEPFDLFVFIVLVAVYFVFRISLTFPRRTSVKREAAKRPLSHQKQSSPRTRCTQRSGRQNDHCLADDHVACSCRAADEPSFRVHRRPTETEHAEALGMAAVMQQRRQWPPVRCALAARNAWVLQNAQ
jgi:hypothetical protein